MRIVAWSCRVNIDKACAKMKDDVTFFDVFNDSTCTSSRARNLECIRIHHDPTHDPTLATPSALQTRANSTRLPLLNSPALCKPSTSAPSHSSIARTSLHLPAPCPNSFSRTCKTVITHRHCNLGGGGVVLFPPFALFFDKSVLLVPPPPLEVLAPLPGGQFGDGCRFPLAKAHVGYLWTSRSVVDLAHKCFRQ